MTRPAVPLDDEDIEIASVAAARRVWRGRARYSYHRIWRGEGRPPGPHDLNHGWHWRTAEDMAWWIRRRLQDGHELRARVGFKGAMFWAVSDGTPEAKEG